jgi:prepilin-type N-terminal cleavage/methylation domain-containing protein
MKQGFTLIELLIAIILAATGLMVLMQLMGVAIFADSNIEYSLTALNLANEKLEELKDDGYSHANLDPASSPFTEASISGFDFVDQRLWTVDYIDANLSTSVSDTGLKDVTVEVQWSQKGGTQSVAVETLIADY